MAGRMVQTMVDLTAANWVETKDEKWVEVWAEMKAAESAELKALLMVD